SNNDGCVIARSADAKPFVKMGEPYFKIQGVLRQHGIVAFSSNYALYGDMSERVMTVIESLVPAVEVYSIDESFADLTGIADPEAVGRQIRREVLLRTGIPVGVGIASTKTLAKLANHAAKRWRCGMAGLCDDGPRERCSRSLASSAVVGGWGIGWRMTDHLQGLGVETAWDWAHADAWTLRKRFAAVVEKTARELRGTPCID